MQQRAVSAIRFQARARSRSMHFSSCQKRTHERGGDRGLGARSPEHGRLGSLRSRQHDGCAGSALALGIGAFLLSRFGYAAVFRVLAVAFLLFSLPAFFWIRERPKERLSGRFPTVFTSPRIMVDAWRQAARCPGVVRFLIGRFLYTDAINTVFLFNAVFARLEMGFTNAQTDRLAIVAILCAALGATFAGRAVDRFGPRHVLNAALYLQIAGLAAAVTAALTDVQAIGWFVAVGGGAGIGAAWTADRVYMTRLSLPHLLGEFFGLYAIVRRFVAVLGPLAWAPIADGFGWGDAPQRSQRWDLHPRRALRAPGCERQDLRERPGGRLTCGTLTLVSASPQSTEASRDPDPLMHQHRGAFRHRARQAHRGCDRDRRAGVC